MPDRVALEELCETRNWRVVNHADVLSHFLRDESYTATELAKEMVVHRSTVNRYLEDLRWAGWLVLVQRHPRRYRRVPDE